MNRKWTAAGLAVLLVASFPLSAGLIEADRDRWRPFFVDVRPEIPVRSWQLPFQTGDRSDLSTVRVISTYAAPRLSYLSGHLHSGIDLVPGERAGSGATVYPLAPGRVCSIHLGHPYITIVVVHLLGDGSLLYTSYKHVQEIYVENGQAVTADTPLARLYTRAEARAQGGNYDHLHLEVRRSFDDYGVASWASLGRAELDSRFQDPLVFLRRMLAR
jgi:murein DD-endopeptidase MepM/ murein hydrolase activator NlpD